MHVRLVHENAEGEPKQKEPQQKEPVTIGYVHILSAII